MTLINMIPENVGWVLVGIFMAADIVAAYALGKTFVNMWRERCTEE